MNLLADVACGTTETKWDALEICVLLVCIAAVIIVWLFKRN